MENQHRRIKGYKELNLEEIELMNEVKTLGAQLAWMVEKLKSEDAPFEIDRRWVDIGAVDLQKGLMALTRAIAKPEFF